MSTHRSRFKRTRSQTKARALPLPVLLPHVLATTDSAGRLSVIIDGTPVPGGPVGRQAFGALLDDIIKDHGTCLRVEVHEADGTTYTDILTPSAVARAEPAPATAQHAEREENPGKANTANVGGDGFIPGEDVAIAAIIVETAATVDGHVHALIDTVQSDGIGEVIVFGRTSGRTIVIQASP